jgi:hypothetical protein
MNESIHHFNLNITHRFVVCYNNNIVDDDMMYWIEEVRNREMNKHNRISSSIKLVAIENYSIRVFKQYW